MQAIMKTLLIIIFLFVSLYSFGQTRNKFQIKGTIEGNYTGKVFLGYPLADTINVLDSTKVLNGNFNFSGFISEPVQAMIHLGNGSAISWLYLDTGTISIAAKKFIANQSGMVTSGLEVTSVTGSFSDSLENDFSNFWQELNKSDRPDSIKAKLLFVEMAAFVRKYPAHNLSSSFLSEAAMFGSLNYQQAVAIFELLDKRQKDKAEITGVALSLKMLNKTGVGTAYKFITQPDTLGRLVSGKELTYDYLLIDFWASWCMPCRDVHPNLISAYKKYNKRGLEILSVSLDEDRNEWIKAIRQDKIMWTQVSDLKGMRENALAKYYSISYVPFNILIDKNGKIIETNLKGEILKNRLEFLFKE